MPYTSRTRIALSALALSLALSCTTPVASEDMVPDHVKVTHQHPTTVAVQAQGSPSGWTSGPRIAGEALGEAIEVAIADCGVFELASEEHAPEYMIETSITKLEESDLGLDMTAELGMCWQLVHKDGGEPIWESHYTTNHLANTYDAETIDERLMIAIEGAVQKNVEQALREMSAIDFDLASMPAEEQS